MSNPARERGAQAPVSTAEPGTPDGLHCALIAGAPASPSPSPAAGTRTQALPEAARGLRSRKANCKSSEWGRSRAGSCQVPWSTEKTGNCVRCHSCAGLDHQSHTESGVKWSLFSWNAPAISRASPTNDPRHPSRSTRCSARQKGRARHCQKISCYLKYKAGDRT